MAAPAPSSLSPIEIGVFIQAFGNGILILQMFSYFEKCGMDARFIRFMVLLIWITSTVALIFCAWALGSSFTYDQGHSIPPQLLLLVGGISGNAMHNLIQVLRTYQMYKLGGGRPWLPVFCWLLSAYSIISSFIVMPSGGSLGNLNFSARLQLNFSAWMVYSACSVIILNQLLTSANTYKYLVMGQDHRSRSAMRNVIRSLTAIAIRVAVGITIAGVCLIIVFVTSRSMGQGLWVGILLSVTTLHPTLLMRSLNGRGKLRKKYLADNARIPPPSALAFNRSPRPRISSGSVLIIGREAMVPDNGSVRRSSVDQDPS